MAGATLSVVAHGGHHDDSGPRTTLGFWIYLMSDCLIFCVLFATFGVLMDATAGGPSGRQLFELPFVLGETMLLLASSFTFGLGMLAMQAGHANRVIGWLAATLALGTVFVGMEIHEFAKLVRDGNGPTSSAFLSSYFGLVGTHGLHVLCGLIWIAVMMHQTWRFGLDAIVRRRLACLSLFWHFLDLVWICVFTFVYLRDFT